MTGECRNCGALLIHDPRQTDKPGDCRLIHHYRCSGCGEGGSVVTSAGEITQRHGVCDSATNRPPAAGRAVADGGRELGVRATPDADTGTPMDSSESYRGMQFMDGDGNE